MEYKKKISFDLCALAQDYFQNMLSEIKGIKCLVLDEETTGNF